uniref:Muscarinic acetylcholine receptor n=1 Tax=Salarias fasciatus TaxID=181472 RepID=A0A672IQI1_SALFA
METLSSTNDSSTCPSVDNGDAAGSPYKALEMFFIALVTGSLSFVTVTGNILVMLSIKVNRHLQTVNNYFLFSLACADLIIGVFSMNLYTVYIIVGYWPLGPVVCDLWLALDYVVSNASVMNLLIISFDRYFCVTKPLTYPTRRTTKMAGLMIAAAWILSFILWAPAILFWQFIVGERTVPAGECYIQFLSNPVVTFGTAIAAFYLPVIIMTVLYINISLASRSRVSKHKPEKKEKKGIKYDSQLNEESSFKAEQQQRDQSPGQSALHSQTQPGLHHHRRGVREERPPGRGQGGSVGAVSAQPGSHSGTQDAQHPNCYITFRPFSSQILNVQLIDISTITVCYVTKTIFAILLAFIITWTPYNVMVLISTFCHSCVPDTVWAIGYWLCYVNSTINPACYALCNATFKKTFKNLLLCQYKNIGTR